MIVEADGIGFDNNTYYAEGDVLFERDGVIVVTLPDQRIEITDVGDLLAAA